jgi:hypothetical protein
MTETTRYPARDVTWGIRRLVGLRPAPMWPARLGPEWQQLRRAMRPIRIRWGWVLFLAIVLVLSMGECGPTVSAFVPIW